MRRRRGRRGSALAEFALAGIPLIFAWISLEEMARGMWIYHTIQYATKVTGSYIAVHGATCAVAPNSCTVQIKDIAGVMERAAVGLPKNSLNVTFTTQSGTTKNCNPISNCDTDTTQWPPTASSDNAVGKYFTVQADYVFRSALSMTSQGPGAARVLFGAFHLPGYTRQFVLF